MSTGVPTLGHLEAMSIFGEDSESACEEVYASSQGTDEDRKFDEIVGVLEDTLMDENFVRMQQCFLNRWCAEFEDTDENKLMYTEIFGQWTEMIESFLDCRLKERIDGFDMAAFFEVLTERGSQDITGDVFDMLTSLGDFAEFKDLMLAHKRGTCMTGSAVAVAVGTGADAPSSSGGRGSGGMDWDSCRPHCAYPEDDYEPLSAPKRK